MRLVQFSNEYDRHHVGMVEDNSTICPLRGVSYVRDLVLAAHRAGHTLAQEVEARLGRQTVSYDRLIAERRVLPPLDHPDPAHVCVTGTGLTHLGSAKARDSMHAKASAAAGPMTDSMRIFQQGLEGGRPPAGQIGFQPEWFWKGDGSWVVPPEFPLELPPFALDGGEEAEIVGLYVIADDGTVLRAGFALGNEFSDHVMERQNYLYLAHSKLRTSSFGPELLVGDLPQDISGTARVLRGDNELWSATFLTGEANMSHSIANLEHHHFKYPQFRRPGDVHVHFFGAAILSFSAGIQAQPGDVFEISAPPFVRPLRNPLARTAERAELVTVQPV